MAVDIDILLLGPFRDVIARAQEAVTNAQQDQNTDHAVSELCNLMLKTSQTLLKEGERALKRIQPLWDGQIDKYGDAFANSLVQNSDVEEKRRKLEDVLYDFDDYIDPATFEAERYAEVQSATRALALSVIDFIKKTKLDSNVHASKFPPLPPLPPLTPLSRSSSAVSNASSSRPSTATAITALGGGRGRIAQKRLQADRSISPPPPLPSSAPPAVPGLSDFIKNSTTSPTPGSLSGVPNHPLRFHPAKHSQDHSVRSRRSIVSNTTSRSRLSQISLDSLPPPAYSASRELTSTPKTPLLDEHMPEHVPTRSSVCSDNNDSASELPSPESLAIYNRSQQTLSPAKSTTDADTRAFANYTAFPIPRSSTGSSQGSSTRINAWVSDQAEASQQSSALRQGVPSVEATQALRSLTIPEDRAVGIIRAQQHDSMCFDSLLTPILTQIGNFNLNLPAASSPSVDMSTNSPERTRMTPLSQPTSTLFQQSQTSPSLKDTASIRSPHTIPSPGLTPFSLPAAALESLQQPVGLSQRNVPATVPPINASGSREDWQAEARTIISDRASTSAGCSTHSGLSHPSAAAFPQPREPDTGIGARNSLYALAGFCEGATNFRISDHDTGVRKVAGHVAGVSTATARCTTCSYGHAYTELELDIHDKSSRATFPRPDGVLFRIRLLYKSHLVSQRPSEAFYGCIFCAQLGHVIHEGDATVFRCSDDLFRHLARHPQPLPEILGVTVLYGKNILTTDPRVNDFDLWLGEGPKPLPEVPLAIDLAKLPVATANKNHVQRYMEKKLPRPEGKNSDSLLQFFVGARIIGVEFPPAFAGKWCTGFHDGEWGYFPSKVIELEKPRPGRLDAPPMQFQGNGGGGSNITVVTRFKWDIGPHSSEKSSWLSFDKGEKITNVAWPVLWEGVGGGREAWCWSGTNAKGRFGVFPRSHVDETTLKDAARPFSPNSAGNGSGTGWTMINRREGGAGKAKSLFRIKRRGSLDSSRSGHSGGVVEIIR